LESKPARQNQQTGEGGHGQHTDSPLTALHSEISESCWLTSITCLLVELGIHQIERIVRGPLKSQLSRSLCWSSMRVVFVGRSCAFRIRIQAEHEAKVELGPARSVPLPGRSKIFHTAPGHRRRTFFFCSCLGMDASARRPMDVLCGRNCGQAID